MNDFKDNPVPSLDRISIGPEYPTDNTMMLDDKEYLIESPAWSLLVILKESKNHEALASKIIEFIQREYSNKDNLQNGVETNKEQPKLKCKHDNYCSNLGKECICADDR